MQIGSKNSIIFQWLREGFAGRLTQLLKEIGYSTNQKLLGIDVARLAKETGCTVTMLRRYLNSTALPSFPVIEKMASQLKVDPIWLFCGYTETHPLDLELLKMILVKIQPKLCHTKTSPDEFLHTIQYACEIYEHLSKIDNTNELEKQRLISWMLSNLNANKKMNPASPKILKGKPQ